MKLATTYLGFKLRTPLVPSASPLSEKLDNIKRMEDAGASAVVFHSLFEEQLRPANHPMRRGSGNGGEFSRDALDDYSDEPDFKVDPEAYVNHIAKAKEAVRIPIIGSLNGSTFGGWQRYARLIEKAGADALELNIYNVPTDPERTANDIETEYLTIVTSIKGLLKIPVAVKLSPYFTNLSSLRDASTSKAPTRSCCSTVFTNRTSNWRRSRSARTCFSARRWRCVCRCAGLHCCMDGSAQISRPRAGFITASTR